MLSPTIFLQQSFDVRPKKDDKALNDPVVSVLSEWNGAALQHIRQVRSFLERNLKDKDCIYLQR